MHQFLTRSINRLVMGSFVFVLLLPLGFIISSLSQHSWDSAQKELKEKHLLIAKNMANPVSLYFSSYQQTLDTFVESTNLSTKSIQGIKTLTDGLVNSRDNFVAISFLSIEDGSSIASISTASTDRCAWKVSSDTSNCPNSACRARAPWNATSLACWPATHASFRRRMMIQRKGMTARCANWDC